LLYFVRYFTLWVLGCFEGCKASLIHKLSTPISLLRVHLTYIIVLISRCADLYLHTLLIYFRYPAFVVRLIIDNLISNNVSKLSFKSFISAFRFFSSLFLYHRHTDLTSQTISLVCVGLYTNCHHVVWRTNINQRD